MIKNFIPTMSDTVGKYRKEEHFKEAHCVFAQTKKGVLPVIELRLYNRNGSDTWYASVWVLNENGYTQATGGGKASGYGYDKASAAATEALVNAGVEWEKGQDPDARGMEIVMVGMIELARLISFEPICTFVAHG